jgi:dTDP-4-amino-4,6-dideoxygalactose transaminase
VKLKHLSRWNKERREHALEYNKAFRSARVDVVTPFEPGSCRSVYHLYIVRVQDREQTQLALRQQNIGTGIHYPVPLHLQKAYAHLDFHVGDFPVTERVASQIVSLPIFPQISAEQIERVVGTVSDTVSRGTVVS